MALAVAARRSRFLLARPRARRTWPRSATRWTAAAGVSLLQRVVLGALSPLQRGVGAGRGRRGRGVARLGFHRETYAREPPPREPAARARGRAAGAIAPRAGGRAAARAARAAQGAAARHARRAGGRPRRRAVVPHAHARPRRADGVALDAPVISPTGCRRPRVRGRARTPRAVQVLLDRDSGAGVAGRAQPRRGRRLRPGLEPGDGRRRPGAQVRPRARRRGRWATSSSPRASTASTRRGSWSAACASWARGRGSSATSASSPRRASTASRRCSWSDGAEASLETPRSVRVSARFWTALGPRRRGARRDGARLPRARPGPALRPVPARGRLLRPRRRRDARACSRASRPAGCRTSLFGGRVLGPLGAVEAARRLRRWARRRALPDLDARPRARSPSCSPRWRTGCSCRGSRRSSRSSAWPLACWRCAARRDRQRARRRGCCSRSSRRRRLA